MPPYCPVSSERDRFCAAQRSAGQVLVCGCGWVTVGDGGCWWVLVLRWVRAARETESSAVSSATALVATVNISP